MTWGYIYNWISPHQGRDPRFVTPALPSRRLDRELRIKLCEWAKRSWKHPENVGLCLSLSRELRVDLNEVMCANGLTLFHFACISGSYELLAALLPAANLAILTFHGDSPFYLAACAASWLETRQGSEKIFQRLRGG